MNYWKIILATVVIYGAGVLTGGLLVQNIGGSRPQLQPHSQAPNPDTHPPDFRSDPMRSPDAFRQGRPEVEVFGRQFVQQLDDALRLTSDQRDKISKIIADGQERNREVWTNYTPQMHKVMQDVQQRIRAELTPDQLKKFETMMKPHPPRRPFPGSNAQSGFHSNFPAPTNVPPLTDSNLSPEVRAIMIKAEQLRASLTNESQLVPPPPPIEFTPSPAPTN